MSELLCQRCGQPILPGQWVQPIGPTDEEIAERRIFTGDELLMAHANPQDCQGLEERESDEEV